MKKISAELTEDNSIILKGISKRDIEEWRGQKMAFYNFVDNILICGSRNIQIGTAMPITNLDDDMEEDY
ncbi:MAG: hypothetical protein QXL94_08695 [Candidatus Parvarchaeum sp.]